MSIVSMNQLRMSIRFLLYLALMLTVLITFTDINLFAATNTSKTSFTCHLTVNKAKDWNKQTVVINLVDFNSGKVITTFTLSAANPKQHKKSVYTLTKKFNCVKHPTTQLIAHYYPIIWSSNKGKTYLSQQVFRLGNQITSAQKNNIAYLQITVNFPADFLNVPDQINVSPTN